MQVDFDVPAADVATIRVEAPSQKAALKKENEQTDKTVAANDNGIRWSLVRFPEGWYASF